MAGSMLGLHKNVTKNTNHRLHWLNNMWPFIWRSVTLYSLCEWAPVFITIDVTHYSRNFKLNRLAFSLIAICNALLWNGQSTGGAYEHHEAQSEHYEGESLKCSKRTQLVIETIGETLKNQFMVSIGNFILSAMVDVWSYIPFKYHYP